MSDGSVRCWGGNNEGQLGIAQPVGTGATVPVEVELSSGRFSDVVEVRTGAASTCARRVDGTVTCWGANSFGQLGGGLPIGADIVGDPWGANANGELGLGDASGRNTPSELPAAAWCPALD